MISNTENAWEAESAIFFSDSGSIYGNAIGLIKLQCSIESVSLDTIAIGNGNISAGVIK